MKIRISLTLGVSMIALACVSRAYSQSETVVITGTSFPDPVSVDKTGVAAANIPRSIQTVPRALIDQQGATKLADTLRNVSGVTQGGQFAFGFYDRFVIRGLNATFLNDGLPDETSDLGGYVHSLTGVERVEVLKGPGSAMYGSTEPGGTINLVHYRPSPAPSASLSQQFGSYGTYTTDAALNGAIGIEGVSARLDGEFQTSEGFRNRASRNGDLLASLGYQAGDHNLLLRYEYHHLENVPDAIGTPFSTTSTPLNTGRPLNVSRDTTYYTPFAFANQEFHDAYFTDNWTIDSGVTVNTRLSYTARTVDLARNGGGALGASGSLFRLTGRQLRRQMDNSSDFNIQVEPVWHFATGDITHTLVTGVQYRAINGGTVRSTADLPNITDVYNPVTPETSLGALTFLCDASHSCNNARLLMQDTGVYALDQVDLTPDWKLRISGRGDWFDTSATGRATIPLNAGSQHPCTPPAATQCPLLPGIPFSRSDSIFSWDVGTVYFFDPRLSAFVGYSSTAYPVFNTEEPQSVGQLPESGTQIEGGLRWNNAWLNVSTAAYQATRKNVFTTITIPNPSGPGTVSDVTVFSYESRGVETDINLHPLDGWNIVANYTVNAATITSLPTAPGNVGKAAPSTPNTIANIWTSYDIPLPAPLTSLQISAGLRYRSHMYGDMGQTRFIPGVPLFDIGLSLPYQNWTLRAGIQNLADRNNWSYGAGTGSGVMPGQGRTFFVKVAGTL